VKIGDFVHNVPMEKYGLIVKERRSITDDKGEIVERVFEVLYAGCEIVTTGSTFLERACEVYESR